MMKELRENEPVCSLLPTGEQTDDDDHHHHNIHHLKPVLTIIQEHVCKFGNKPPYGSCGLWTGLWTILLHGSMSSNCVLLFLPDVADG